MYFRGLARGFFLVADAGAPFVVAPLQTTWSSGSSVAVCVHAAFESGFCRDGNEDLKGDVLSFHATSTL